ncbi:OmpA family protein [Zemynaea arenosa]|nr:OmpA family protein [Massilia arenosa]
MIAWTRLLAALTFALTATLAHAGDPNDVPGTADHPQVTRFPNFHLDTSAQSDYNEFAFPVKGNQTTTKGGKHWVIDYVLNEGARAPSQAELVKNYENAFKKVGGALVFRGPYGNEATYRQPMDGGGERWMLLHVTSDFRYTVTIVDVAPMEQKLEFDAGQMAEAIKKNGFVALNGILFDTGKATIQGESQPLIAEMVTLLKNDPSLKLTVVGHTDNVGDKKANLDLSKKRADSVMRALVAGGIDAKRLKADGKGDTQPSSDNRTEEGRAKNRRVELVKA